MKILQEQQAREEYIQTQIDRSEAKFNMCKVSTWDVLKYRRIIERDRRDQKVLGTPGPIVCLGTRNGREVDIFRMHFASPTLLSLLTRFAEIDTHSFISILPFVEATGRSRVSQLTDMSVVGVEINPRAERQDVWVGSFDDMPREWAGTFGIVFSNSFDQSQDPHQSAAQWKRIVRPGGYLIICFDHDLEPTVTDPVGDIQLADIQNLFGGTLIYFARRGSRNFYSEVIFRLN
jgi:hypothetical protein